MARSRLVPPPPPRKPPRVVKRVPSSSSKLLEPCGRCDAQVFWCTFGTLGHGQRVAVEVLERLTGDVGIQTQIASDELTATMSGTATFYKLHACRLRSFTRPAARKTR